ncbi:hypothetical protein M3Y94_00616900 [Aphelenchoides besseyi]|nr:hypothetical protein M3Y94_00616900 [Aphelenchoides besseyi]KAI6218892.1 hypothetical protein M3Y95_01136300 [Aphelenchoides besseyi]
MAGTPGNKSQVPSANVASVYLNNQGPVGGGQSAGGMGGSSTGMGSATPSPIASGNQFVPSPSGNRGATSAYLGAPGGAAGSIYMTNAGAMGGNQQAGSGATGGMGSATPSPIASGNQFVPSPSGNRGATSAYLGAPGGAAGSIYMTNAGAMGGNQQAGSGATGGMGSATPSPIASGNQFGQSSGGNRATSSAYLGAPGGGAGSVYMASGGAIGGGNQFVASPGVQGLNAGGATSPALGGQRSTIAPLSMAFVPGAQSGYIIDQNRRPAGQQQASQPVGQPSPSTNTAEQNPQTARSTGQSLIQTAQPGAPSTTPSMIGVATARPQSSVGNLSVQQTQQGTATLGPATPTVVHATPTLVHATPTHIQATPTQKPLTITPTSPGQRITVADVTKLIGTATARDPTALGAAKEDDRNVIVEPEHVVYQPPYNKAQTADLKITNRSKKFVQFKVLATAPKFYRVRNKVGALKPGDSIISTIKLDALADAKKSSKEGHKIVVQTALSDQLDVNRDHFWRDVDERRNNVQFARLRVFLLQPGETVGALNVPEEAAPKTNQGIIVEPESELLFRGPFNEIVTSAICVINNTDKYMYIRVLVTNFEAFRARPNYAILAPRAMQVLAAMVQPLDDYHKMEKKKNKFMIEFSEADTNTKGHEEFWKAVSRFQSVKLKAIFQND